MRFSLPVPAILVASLCAAFSPTKVRAEEQTSTYRIIGLCWPDRQEDLRRVMTEIPEFELASIDYDKGEVTFRYDQARFFADGKVPKNFTPDKLLERIVNSVSQKSRGTFTITAPSTVPADKLEHLEIKVGILDCKGCRYGVYTTVAKMDGVVHATITDQPSVLTVWIDPAKTNRETLETALKKAKVGVRDAD